MSEKTPNPDDDNTNYSSLIKNLENIKTELVTLREYVVDSTEGFQEKSSSIS